ncbi:uncharacterized protein PGTG_03730 [Puccinia graminis f. sp. tritici CRL 75-36-700-3]|uniref:Cyclin-like domain-containing protein n=1 Tax=Puccinia graminis f. sp. tritici (strain CRL 75-36-700-3 / race SCCL) TaxID=418459 RepID=E3K0E9_PUCGT|nr:uncharacterized protein PGTG_03730 [Puccinia graminis f. sp. tritici CRL 75-36-700-3]EFP77774.2 hypothetical protein PGTG_03730 [Puccinia graminis f. sp. tritici CRL 75-36-700-3]
MDHSAGQRVPASATNGTANRGSHPHSLSIIKRYRAYFSLAEVDEMLRRQSAKLVPARVEAIRQQACVFIDKIGSRLGFPRRTIGSALLLYHRFHLFFPFSDFNLHDVSIASVWLASKLEDTLKKLREIQLAAWLVRNLQEGGNGLGEPEPSIIEAERHRLSGIERLLLESVCFDFGSGKPAGGRDVFGYLIGIGRRLGLSRNHIQLSFRLAIDSHRTLVGLTYPPHLISLSCLYLASFMYPNPQEEDLSKFESNWNVPYDADIEDIEEVCHQILDLLISLSSALKTNQSPSSPSEAKGMKSSALGLPSSTASPIPGASELTGLKIKLREIESQRRESSGSEPAPRLVAGGAMLSQEVDELQSDGKEWLGRDDVTVRFIFGADGSENLADPSCPPSRPGI